MNLNRYDYGARFYDPAIGRWHAVDPIIEKHYDYSGYAYTYNNPIRYWDFFGLDSIDAVALTQAIFDAVTKVIEDYGSVSAQCGRGVQLAFKDLTGSDIFDGMTANEMHDYMMASADFEVVGLDEVQGFANDGKIVIPSKAETGSGHVVMGAPGEEEMSGTWGVNVPMVMDTGSDKRETSQKLSLSWVSTAKDDITYFRYMGDTYTSRTYSGGSLGQATVTAPSGAGKIKPHRSITVPAVNTNILRK